MRETVLEVPVLVTDPAHRVAPHALLLLPFGVVEGGEGEGVAGEDLPPVDAPHAAQLTAHRAVLHGDGVEEGQAAPALLCVSPVIILLSL